MKDNKKKNLPEIKKKSVWIISLAAVILTIAVIVFALYLRNRILAKKLVETRRAYEESLRSVDELNNRTEYLENVIAVPAFTADDDGSDLYDVVNIRVHFNGDFSGLPAEEQYLAIREARNRILDFTKGCILNIHPRDIPMTIPSSRFRCVPLPTKRNTGSISIRTPGG